MKTYKSIDALQSVVGEVIGVSDWLTVDQARIDQFAQATNDWQWIHVDPLRSKDGPYGGTIAHGFLTLSLLPAFTKTAYEVQHSSAGVNYGLGRVRFPAPVPVDSQLRGTFKLLAFDALPSGGAQLTIELTVERQGSTRPVCVAEVIIRRLP